MYPNPPPYDDNNPPTVALADPSRFAPLQPINQQPPGYQPQKPIYPPQSSIYHQQQPPTVIIQQQNRPYRWYNPNVVGPPGFKPPKSIYTSPLTWSIVNSVFFFPLLIWIPGLLFSLKSKNAYKRANYQDSSQNSRRATILNLVCTILGNICFNLNVILSQIFESRQLNITLIIV